MPSAFTRAEQKIGGSFMFKISKALTVAAFSSSVAFAGFVDAGKAAGENTRVAAINLNKTLGVSKGGALRNTGDTAVAILDKEGKLIQVIFSGTKAKTLWNASVEKAKALQEAGINATSGVSEDVTNQAFDYTEKGVAITGGAAKYAVKMSLGSLEKLGSGTKVGEYTLVPLGAHSAKAANCAVNYVLDDAHTVVSISKSLVSESHNLIRSILKLSASGAKDATVGIGKTALNAPIQVVNSLSKITSFFGFEYEIPTIK